MLQRTLTHNSRTASVASGSEKPIVKLTFLTRREVHGPSQEFQQLGSVFSQALRVCQPRRRCGPFGCDCEETSLAIACPRASISANCAPAKAAAPAPRAQFLVHLNG